MSRVLLGIDMSQYKPLYDEDPDDEAFASGRPAYSSTRTWKYIAAAELLVIVAMFLVTIALPLRDQCRTPYSLVEDVTKYETRVFLSGKDENRSRFHGPPSVSVDAAWDDLFTGTLFRISEEEERSLPNRTTPIPGDISHYAASLSVVHHLHCVNFFRKTMWPDYYGDSFRLDHSGSIRKHHEHCVEQLRQTLMCNPDTTAAVIQWVESEKELHVVSDTQHTCVDYPRIQEWMRIRALSDAEFDKHVLVAGAPVHQTY